MVSAELCDSVAGCSECLLSLVGFFQFVLGFVRRVLL